ncbi:MAG: hypothetical protein K8R21_01245, partial [Leptospira sp.]|nr:hypothetical protein [Leptospira sp.]
TRSMTECKEKTAPGNTDPIPAGSNSEHKIAIHKTCALAEITNVDMNETAKTKLYFKRLKIIYDEIRKRNIKIINVFAPYSDLIRNLGGKERALFWKAELEKILGKENTVTEDMQFILDGPKNGDYCYDAIHLNRFGMEIFSEKLGDYLLKNYGKPGN